jgi:N-acetylneuraminate synthase/sialic acid synthase
MRQIEINKRVYSDDTNPYVIAEVGHNHQGKLETALNLIKAASDSGATAVKFQKRSNKELFTKLAYDAPYVNENSYGATYGEHRDALEFGLTEYKECVDLAKSLGIDFFATAFDFPSVDFLMNLDMPVFKVASGDLKTTPLLKYIAETKKPMIISTGGAKLDDIRRAFDVIWPINKNLAILQCTAGYPPKFEELNLKVIETLRTEYPDTVIGYSGHDSGIAMALVSYVLGARVIEKHFTLNRAMKGTDHSFSLEPAGMHKLVRDINRARISMGDGVKTTYDSEVAPLTKMGKSMFFKEPYAAGTIINEEMIVLKSPGGYLAPFEINSFLGKKLKSEVEAETPLSFELIE